ncbi:MAG TPA: hypothetical protein VFJ65_03320 [Solirubrobacterales bacterium]|nr:hypothetical protein [Solirubrobacterales bacterium]
MEALLEREGKVENWNDDRLDELSRRMDAGFAQAATKEEMNQRFDEVDRNFGTLEHQLGRLNDRIDRFGYAMMFFGFSLSAAVIANGIFG